jgi:hypothetical protein
MRDGQINEKPYRAGPAPVAPDEVYDSWDEASDPRRKRGDADGLFHVREDRNTPGRRGSGKADDDPFDI